MTPTYIGFVYNAQHPTALQMTEAVMRSLDLGEDCWLSAAEDLDDMRPLLNDTRFIVIAGGDGTILRVVRSIAEFGVPLVGINMGRVGFMAELQVHEVMEELPTYLNGSARMEERMMLEVSVAHGDEQEPYLTLHALNDVVVGRGGSARLLDIVATIDGVILTNYRADAVHSLHCHRQHRLRPVRGRPHHVPGNEGNAHPAGSSPHRPPQRPHSPRLHQA